MDHHPVTNAEFRRFVKDTGHLTTAEIAPLAADFPDASADQLVPGSLVFTPPDHPVPLQDYRAWWSWVPGAQWRHPDGPGSTLHGRDRHPVVHVNHADASAYAAWAGKELPTEAEWEYAARGGLDGATYAWGDEPTVRGRLMANTWHGSFPHENLRLDGYERTSPIGSFPPNGYGLVDVCGNVWEWTASSFTPDHGVATTPQPSSATLLRADGCHPVLRRGAGDQGGSHLCAPNYCLRYRPAPVRRRRPTPPPATSGFAASCGSAASRMAGRVAVSNSCRLARFAVACPLAESTAYLVIPGCIRSATGRAGGLVIRPGYRVARMGVWNARVEGPRSEQLE